MALMNVTREQVVAAMAECDALGVDTFLAKYGYRPSRAYALAHAGKLYPSKAILGVAAGLAPSAFSGGAAHTSRTLARLGFTVRQAATRRLAKLFRIAAALGFSSVAPVALNAEPVAVFASGANHAGEIQGFADVQHDVGVAAPELSAAGEAALIALAGTDVQVFVDSGAFSEFTKGHAITDADWRERLALYRRLAVKLGDQVHVVAPDKVGDQEETLARLATYRAEVAELHQFGARVLVPIQKGARSQADFAAAVSSVLGFTGWVPAVPMKMAATSTEELAAFVAAVQPAQLHLLGIGPRSRNAAEVFAAIRTAAPSCLFTCDSNIARAHVGRAGNGRTKARTLTAAMDLVMATWNTDWWTTAERKRLAVALAFSGAAA